MENNFVLQFFFVYLYCVKKSKMKIDELKELIKNGKKTNATLPLIQLEQLKKVADVTFEINRETNDYFYKVNLNDLVDKEFKQELLTDNKWELSDNGEEIYLFT